ncbi:alpha/beta hydrolase family protein [Bifidobacterium oedipodis]|nr:alpha/beta hydrolase [Bifidobacterium sp. DSM 109957]
MVSLPIFIILVGILVFVSNAITVPWNIEPTGMSMATLSADTDVTFANPAGASLPGKGTYETCERAMTFRLARDGSLVGQPTNSDVNEAEDTTWQVEGSGDDAMQTITMLIRQPVRLADTSGSTGTTANADDSDADDGSRDGQTAVDEESGDIASATCDADQSINGRFPGVLFMHGAGFGTAYDSFGDVATELASAGFVTAVIDKPVWDTTDINRDYPASATAYEQAVRILRSQSNVDADNIGIYATSESTWISSYLLQQDKNIAFQILLSPMVFTPRQALGFFVTQDFALVGANDGYQSIVQRVFSVDASLFSLTNLDIQTLNPEAFAIPTYIAYGSKDVMTAQVEGARRMLFEAHQGDNWDVTIRSYPVANHVLKLGDESESGTPFADAYTNDLIDWAVGTTRGLAQTSERVAGADLYQSVALPTNLKPRRALTIYGVILHVSMLVLMLASLAVSVTALIRTIMVRARWRRQAHAAARSKMPVPAKPVVLGFAHGFGSALLTLTVTTMATLAIFAAGLGQVIMGVVRLAWGDAPSETPGVMYWSWPVIQAVTLMVVWAWSRVFMRLIEVASQRGILQWPPRKGSVRGIVTGAEPVLASTRLGRVLFWVVAVTMLYVMLFFAFWGLFIY